MKIVLVVCATSLILAGCMVPSPLVAPAPPGASQPMPTSTPETTPTEQPSATPTMLPTPAPSPEAAPSETESPAAAGSAAITAAAVQFAAAELDVDAASIEVVSVQSVDWNNSCLGVERPGEMCMQVLTSGYRVLLDVDGQQIAVHTNDDGSVMRLAGPAEGVRG